MSAAEAPKSEQIQANVAAALSRLRGELGAASSPVASATPIPLPKTPSGPIGGSVTVEPEPEPVNLAPLPATPLPATPLPAGPVRMTDLDRPSTGLRPFEPILNAAVGSAASNDSEPPKMEEAPAPKPDLFGRLRAEPTLSAERAAASEAKTDSQPDLLSGMEVPPAPPPPLGSFEAEDEDNGRGRRMRNRLMVLVALVVIAGGAAWAWVSSHRGVEGPAPVITAETTPEKVKPTDEGGMQVPNQNVQILDNMNGQAANGQQQENVLPPPEQPVAPPSTDTTDQASAAPQAPAITDAPTPTPPAATEQSAAPSVAAPAIPSVTAPEPGTTASAAAPATPEPQQAAPAPAATTPAPVVAAPAAPAEATPAPAAPKAEPTQTAAAPTAAPAKTEVAPTAGGTARVQLAAVKSEALASAQWAKMQKAHPDLLGALTLNVEKVVKSDGSTLFRVQAGPLTKAQAKDLCTKLKAAKQDCLVAK